MKTKVNKLGHINCQLVKLEDGVNGSVNCSFDGIIWEMSLRGLS